MKKVKVLAVTLLIIMSQFIGIVVNAEEIFSSASASIFWTEAGTDQKVLGIELEKGEKQTIMLNDEATESDILIETTDSVYIDIDETNQLNENIAVIRTDDRNQYQLEWEISGQNNQALIVFVGLKEGKGKILSKTTKNNKDYEGDSLSYEVLPYNQLDSLDSLKRDDSEGEFDKIDLSLTYVDNTIEKALTGKNYYYYINASLSGLNSKYSNPYQVITFDKKIIEKITVKSLGTSESIENIEVTEDDENYYVKLFYNELVGGTAVSVPINFTTKNKIFMNDEEYSFTQELYSKDDELLSVKDSVFIASTLSTNISGKYTYQYVYKSSLTEDSLIETGHIVSVPGADVNQYKIGGDRRDVKVTFNLDEKMGFIEEEQGNEQYTYDKKTHSITTIVTSTIVPSFKVFSKGLELKRYNVPMTAHYINDDGTLDMSSESNSKSTIDLILYETPGGGGGGTKPDKKNPDLDLIYMYKPVDKAWDFFKEDMDGKIRTIKADINSKPGGLKTVLKQVDIRVNEGILVTGYSLSYKNIGTASEGEILENLKGIENNTLYGVTENGTTEIIAENIPMSDDKTYVDIPEKVYSRIYLSFADELQMSEQGGTHQISLNIKTKMSSNTMEIFKNYFLNNPNLPRTLGATALVSSSAPGELKDTQSRTLYLFKQGTRMTKSALSSQGGLYSRTPFTLEQEYLIQRNEFENGTYDFDNLKYIILLPDGYDYVGLDETNDKNAKALATQEINNYKGTEKTAIVIDLDPNEFYFPITYEERYEFKFLHRVKILIKPQFVATRNAREGLSDVITYLSWGNNGTDESDILGMPGSQDTYDLNENDDVTDLIAMNKSTINLIPGKELLLNKKSKEEKEQIYRSNPIVVEGKETIDYELSVFNNSIINIRDLDLIDILPYADDKSIVSNDAGEYNKRGSDYHLTLSGPIKEAEGYNFLYSTDTPKDTIQENKDDVKWVTSDEISDFSKVKMIRVKANSDTVLDEGKRVNFYYSAQVPDSNQLKEKHKAVNSFAAILNNDPKNSLESLGTIAEVVKYKLEGIVYNDKNKNSIKDTDELGLADYKVEVFNNSDELIATGTTDKEGHYSLDVDKAGDYKVKVTTKTDDIVSEYKASTNLSVNNDFNTSGEGTVTLEKYLSQKVLNMAVSKTEPTVPEESKVIVHYVDETGTELTEDEILDGADKIGEEYQTAAKDIAGYELKETPTNANGKYVVGTIEVTYVYQKIKEESSKVITHYVDEETNQLIEDEILDGTGKIGEDYQTLAKDIAGYELKETPANAKGKYVAGTTEVTYVYKKIKKVETANVIVHHVDESGIKLNEDEVLDGTGKIGEDYQTSSKEIAGYELKETPKNAKGKYALGTTEVTYVYKKVKKVEESKVIVHHVDESGVKLKNDEILDGTDKIGKNYQTSAQKISGYKLKETPKNAKGKYVAGTINVTYVYEKVTEKTIVTDPSQTEEPKDFAGTVYETTVDKEGKKLPQTGENIQDFTILSLVMISLSIVIYRIRQKKIKNNFLNK